MLLPTNIFTEEVHPSKVTTLPDSSSLSLTTLHHTKTNQRNLCEHPSQTPQDKSHVHSLMVSAWSSTTVRIQIILMFLMLWLISV